jgi:hypothetical protein
MKRQLVFLPLILSLFVLVSFKRKEKQNKCKSGRSKDNSPLGKKSKRLKPLGRIISVANILIKKKGSKTNADRQSENAQLSFNSTQTAILVCTNPKHKQRQGKMRVQKVRKQIRKTTKNENSETTKRYSSHSINFNNTIVTITNLKEKHLVVSVKAS